MFYNELDYLDDEEVETICSSEIPLIKFLNTCRSIGAILIYVRIMSMSTSSRSYSALRTSSQSAQSLQKS